MEASGSHSDLFTEFSEKVDFPTKFGTQAGKRGGERQMHGEKEREVNLLSQIDPWRKIDISHFFLITFT